VQQEKAAHRRSGSNGGGVTLNMRCVEVGLNKTWTRDGTKTVSPSVKRRFFFHSGGRGGGGGSSPRAHHTP
jgi:hypothetical protein